MGKQSRDREKNPLVGGITLPGRGGARLSGWVVSLSWGVVAGATAWVGELIDGSMEDCGVKVVVDSGCGSGGA